MRLAAGFAECVDPLALAGERAHRDETPRQISVRRSGAALDGRAAFPA
jgi:hypothetical protein